jgi:hypothetical protein
MTQLAPLHSTIPITQIRKVTDTKIDSQKPKNATLTSGAKSKPKRKTTTGKFDTGHPHQTQTEISAFYNHLSWYNLQLYAHNLVRTPNYTPTTKLLFQNSHQSHPSNTLMAHHFQPTGKLTEDEYFEIASVLKAQTKLLFTPTMIRSMDEGFTTERNTLDKKAPVISPKRQKTVIPELITHKTYNCDATAVNSFFAITLNGHIAAAVATALHRHCERA